jgi:transcriptional regulator with XRE-family HTH domain
LPFCRIKLVGRKPERKLQIDPKTFSDHLRKRRLDLHLTLRDVAKQVGCDPSSVNAWERNYHQPALRRFPAIVAFLGYSLEAASADQPLSVRIASKRRRLGLSQKALAELLGLDEGTVSKWERDESQRRPGRRVQSLVRRWLADSRPR